MTGDLRYAEEKYVTALDSLATGDGSLRDRLLNAYVSQANRAVPLSDGLGAPLPDDLAARITAFDERMTAVKDDGHKFGWTGATVDAMTDDEVQRAAEELVYITIDLVRSNARR
jgi:hypothetical protein